MGKARIYEDAREVPSSRRRSLKDLVFELQMFGGAASPGKTEAFRRWFSTPPIQARERFYGGARWGGNTFMNRLDSLMSEEGEAFLKKPGEEKIEGTVTGRFESGFGLRETARFDLTEEQREKLKGMLGPPMNIQVDFAATERRIAEEVFAQQCAALGVDPERVHEIHRTTVLDFRDAVAFAFDEKHGTTSRWVQDSLIVDGFSNSNQKLLSQLRAFHIPAGPRAEAGRAHRKKMKKVKKRRAR